MKPRKSKDYLFIALRGLAMGAADVVPGVSGGTVAFITGIYDELIDSINKCGPHALIMLFREGFLKTWRHINGNFLLALFLGILVAIKTLAAAMSFALEHYQILVWSFFSGLILASTWILIRTNMRWDIKYILALVLGALFVFLLAISKPAQVPASFLTLFLGGFVAISAMILPGVSGSFILLLVGLYPAFLQAINTLDFAALASFGSGCLVGLLVFVRFLSWLLHRFHTMTLAILIGFLLGSLYVTWPWKITTANYVDRHGELQPMLQSNVMPQTYVELTNLASQVSGSLLCIFLGIFLVLLIDFLTVKLPRIGPKES